MINTFSVR
jgi:hypothetical protein